MCRAASQLTYISLANTLNKAKVGPLARPGVSPPEGSQRITECQLGVD